MTDTRDTEDEVRRRRAEVARSLEAADDDGVHVPDADRWAGLRRPQLRYMLEGEDVAELHRLLEAVGVFDRNPPRPPKPAEGEQPAPDIRGEVRAEVGITDDHRDAWFGPFTERAVRAFQGTARLPVTGAVDDATWLALYDRETGRRR